MSKADARIEVRVSAAVKTRIEYAARLDDLSVSGFVVAAAEQHADEVVRRHQKHTVVPADFFDALIAELDEPAVANPALTAAVRRSRARGARSGR